MKSKVYAIVGIIMLGFMIVLPLYMYFGFVMPMEQKYNRKFRSHVSMATDQATFEGMRSQIVVLWENMNTTFSDYDLNTTYNTWWPPSQTYDNSLGAQRDYFLQLIKSISRYEAMYAKQLGNGTNPAMLEDWYYKSIQNIRSEMGREGGLDWVIKDAYKYNLYPGIYWMLCWEIPVEAVIAISAVMILYKGSKVRKYE